MNLPAFQTLLTPILRREANTKFPAHAHKRHFTREALQQVTPAAVAACRAQRYRERRQIIALGCSVGGDTVKKRGSPTCAGDQLW